MSNLVHNEQVKLAATFWNNLAIAALLSVFLVPAFYTRHTVLQQDRSPNARLQSSNTAEKGTRLKPGGVSSSSPAMRGRFWLRCAVASRFQS